MPHFFVKTADINSDKITVNEKQTVHHLVKVLRSKVGETLLLVDENQTQYETKIVEICSDSIVAQIIKKEKSAHFLNINLYLAQGVLKSDAQSLIIQKATELGVKGIIPLITDNTVVKHSVVDAKIDKWKKTVFEAVKQCERTDIPEIFSRCTLKELLKDPEYDVKIACVERSRKSSMKNFLRELKPEKNTKIVVIIGPEGGFSKTETEMLEKYGAAKVSLGKLILRAETAVITALSNVIYELEND